MFRVYKLERMQPKPEPGSLRTYAPPPILELYAVVLLMPSLSYLRLFGFGSTIIIRITRVASMMMLMLMMITMVATRMTTVRFAAMPNMALIRILTGSGYTMKRT